GLVLSQIVDHDMHRVPQRVDVEAVEADVGTRRAVVVAEPVDERGYFLVGPHPGGPTLEAVEHGAGTRMGVGPILDPPVDPEAIGPVALDSHKGEAPLGDEAASQRGAPAVELGGAVG